MAEGENDTNKKDAASAARAPSAGSAATDPQPAPHRGSTSGSGLPERGVVGTGPCGSGATEGHVDEALAVGPAVTGSGEAAGTEWTASDARGPLSAARPVETVEPLHEGASASSHAPEPASASVSSAAPRRSVAGSVFAGLVIGALIGAGTAALVYRLAPTTGQGDGSRIAALSARVDTLSQRPDPQPSIADLKGTVAALDGRFTALRTSVAALQQAKATVPQGSPASPTSVPVAAQAFDPAPLQQRIATLQGDVDALRKDDAAAKGDTRDLQGRLTVVAAALAASQKQASVVEDGVRDVQGHQKSLQSEQQGLQNQQKALEGKVNAPALAVVADSLVQQIARGLPYVTQVDALASIGADPARVAILRQGADKGVPTAKALGDAFEPLADSVAMTGRKTPPGAGFVARMEAGLFSMVSIRSTSDTTGTSAASRVSRIQADLAHDDVADAYATWGALPAESKAKSEAWGALAKTQTEAMAAARALQHDAIAALGAKKS